MADIFTASPKRLKIWFWLLLLLNAIFITWSRFYLAPLSSGDIIQFEIAKNVDIAAQILSDWSLVPGKTQKAIESIYIDYVFIALYTLGLAVSCMYLSRVSGQEVLIKAGKFLIFLIVGVGICDVIENIAMMKSFNGSLTGGSVRLAYDMAVAKFSVIILCILFIMVCLVFSVFNKPEAKIQYT